MHEIIDHSFTITPHAGSPGDYGAVVNKLLTFNIGDVRVTHTILVNPDTIREDDPNENFFSNIDYASGIQPIIVIRPCAEVIINDSMETECSK